MTRKSLYFIAALCFFITSCSQNKSESLEISFNYTRQMTPGSNQYAVWVEDGNGEVVKTLFVTSFTAKGRARNGEELVRGYIKRPACVPTWVKNVNADALTDEQMDAISGATPDGGEKTFTWDFTDQDGKKVKKGSYRVCLEATLFNQSDILYSGEFTLGAAPCEIQLQSILSEPDEEHEGMISEVKAYLK